MNYSHKIDAYNEFSQCSTDILKHLFGFLKGCTNTLLDHKTDRQRSVRHQCVSSPDQVYKTPRKIYLSNL